MIKDERNHGRERRMDTGETLLALRPGVCYSMGKSGKVEIE